MPDPDAWQQIIDKTFDALLKSRQRRGYQPTRTIPLPPSMQAYLSNNLFLEAYANG